VADLKGKKVTVLKGTAYQRTFDNLLATAGLTEKDVEAAPPIVRITINREDEEAPAAK
jgi:ABC-type nitrate/sulfonate/bicarbonate transport system substrate-binding protein